ncbi:glycosyltransferase family 4 protein [Puniceicoccaceae bacterium K14]|nr:glycosyltransferase family 4 protein [Puniceicoccaceae bacterium K14]
MRKQPIIFVTPELGLSPNGPATYAHYLFEQFKDDPDLQFEVVARTKGINSPIVHDIGEQNTSREFYSALNRKSLEIALKAKQKPIVHFNISQIGKPAVKHGLTSFFQINDDDNAMLPKRALKTLLRDGPKRLVSLYWRRKQEAFAIHHGSLCICNSNHTRSSIIDAYKPEKECHIRTVHKSVDTEFFSPKARLTQGTSLNVLFVGSNWRRKGLISAIKALECIQYPVRFDIAGPSEKEFKAHILPQSNREAKDLTLHNHGLANRDTVKALHQSAHLFLLPSEAEAFGVTILESLASGTPVIGSNVGGIPEILNGLDCAALVEPNNTDQLQNTIEKMMPALLNDPSLINKSRKAAMNFSKKVMLKKIKDLYLAHA